ncbi:L-2-amino-thiazoline-4-carboxylic acid hydrolase [Clostridioides mangenotii]|uniref:L-2-amino-thiazoline-4-carboxylic acid hydrolase n=1 Tax=Metaclostridioides mangenotii TaxID=1540 RepID=UPI001C111564|nr:L-2-amino-thiazoline-4-carboxylic acid hydrolase [Clostridioides mangenotii]
MKTREELAKDFYIDDHAVLFGLLSKYSEMISKENGLKVAEEAVITFGRERGMRCAMRCLQDGEELSVENYTVYGEWVDNRAWSQSEIETISPSFKTKMTSCGWSNSWKKYGLEKYSKIYCSNVDVSLAYGFNPDNKFNLDTSISFGVSYCTFNWTNFSFKSEEELNKMFDKRSRVLDKVIKDFLYQCGHVLNAFKRVAFFNLGIIDGNKIIDSAMKDYQEIFGEDKKNAIVRESQQDFLVI